MKTLILLAFTLAAATLAQAQTVYGTRTPIGRNFGMYSDSTGTYGTDMRIGNSTYFDYSNPRTGQSVSGSRMQTGNQGFYSDSTGTTGTDQRIGNFGFGSYTNPRTGRTTTCMSNRIGSTVFTNCN